MTLKMNIEYWKISLQNPEPVIDDYYIFDEIIVEDENLIKKVERLRELIIAYCVMREKDKKSSGKIIDEIYKILNSTELIQYTEFVAFWKVLDISFSVFKEMQDNKDILYEILEKYCEKRRRLYDRLGYSNIVVQALYDSGASRKKGTAGIEKVLSIAREKLGLEKQLNTIEEVKNFNMGYFLPDKENKELFKSFCKVYGIKYKFGEDHQGKNPDIVLKVEEHFFIIEAKHIKESGGAQDKQIGELIKFISYSEGKENIHYVAFLDGTYFNKFIYATYMASKIKKQKEAIEKCLKENPQNLFVNTAGLCCLFSDLRGYIEHT